MNMYQFQTVQEDSVPETIFCPTRSTRIIGSIKSDNPAYVKRTKELESNIDDSQNRSLCVDETLDWVKDTIPFEIETCLEESKKESCPTTLKRIVCPYKTKNQHYLNMIVDLEPETSKKRSVLSCEDYFIDPEVKRDIIVEDGLVKPVHMFKNEELGTHRYMIIPDGRTIQKRKPNGEVEWENKTFKYEEITEGGDNVREKKETLKIPLAI